MLDGLWDSFLANCLFIIILSLPPICNWGSYIFLVDVQILKYILDTNPLLVSDIAGIFCESVICLFMLPMLSVFEHDLFSPLFCAVSHQHSSFSVTMLIPLVLLHFRCAG